MKRSLKLNLNTQENTVNCSGMDCCVDPVAVCQCCMWAPCLVTKLLWLQIKFGIILYGGCTCMCNGCFGEIC